MWWAGNTGWWHSLWLKKIIGKVISYGQEVYPGCKIVLTQIRIQIIQNKEDKYTKVMHHENNQTIQKRGVTIGSQPLYFKCDRRLVIYIGKKPHTHQILS